MDWVPEDDRHAPAADGVGAGTLTTRPVQFTGATCSSTPMSRGGELRVEVLDRNGNVLAPFTRDACAPVVRDGTRLPVRWTAGSLKDLAGETVRFRFSLTRGRLFAFWVSPWPTGESRGYPAAGGPEFNGPADSTTPRSA